MNTTKQNFAQRLKDGMIALGLEPKPAVLERQFNLHYSGEPMTLHGVRRWIRIPPDELRYGAEIKKEIKQA